MESYAIPFVGMVLHGYMEYSGVALNQQGSYQKALLKNNLDLILCVQEEPNPLLDNIQLKKEGMILMMFF